MLRDKQDYWETEETGRYTFNILQKMKGKKVYLPQKYLYIPE